MNDLRKVVLSSDDMPTRIIIANTSPAFHQDLREIIRYLNPKADVIVVTAPEEDLLQTDIPQDQSQPENRMLSRLSSRQREVTRLLVEGQTNKEIARSLNISPSTVRVHVSSVLRILGVPTRTAAVAVVAGAGQK